jgi:hypothetical protein
MPGRPYFAGARRRLEHKRLNSKQIVIRQLNPRRRFARESRAQVQFWRSASSLSFSEEIIVRWQVNELMWNTSMHASTKNTTLTGQDGIAFLAQCEAAGIALANCDPYAREWITRQENGS